MWASFAGRVRTLYCWHGSAPTGGIKSSAKRLTSATAKSVHDQIFFALLIALGFFLFLIVAQLVILRVAGRLIAEGWVFYSLLCMYGLFLTVDVLALGARILAPMHRRAITILASIILLFFFPFGTAVGIYGLLNVDRGNKG
jgi:hypothetical protein